VIVHYSLIDRSWPLVTHPLIVFTSGSPMNRSWSKSTCQSINIVHHPSIEHDHYSPVVNWSSSLITSQSVDCDCQSLTGPLIVIINHLPNNSDRIKIITKHHQHTNIDAFTPLFTASHNYINNLNVLWSIRLIIWIIYRFVYIFYVQEKIERMEASLMSY
jgi:hypothetical protein